MKDMKYVTFSFNISQGFEGLIINGHIYFPVFLVFSCTKGVLGYFGEVISVAVAIATNGVGVCMKATNRERYPQISHKNLQDRLLNEMVSFPFSLCFSLATKK
jgi:glycerol-3-phosphate acyltransferase PlsY